MAKVFYDVIWRTDLAAYGFWMPSGEFEIYPTEERALEVAKALKRAAGICLHCGKVYDHE